MGLFPDIGHLYEEQPPSGGSYGFYGPPPVSGDWAQGSNGALTGVQSRVRTRTMEDMFGVALANPGQIVNNYGVESRDAILMGQDKYGNNIYYYSGGGGTGYYNPNSDPNAGGEVRQSSESGPQMFEEYQHSTAIPGWTYTALRPTTYGEAVMAERRAELNWAFKTFTPLGKAISVGIAIEDLMKDGMVYSKGGNRNIWPDQYERPNPKNVDWKRGDQELADGITGKNVPKGPGTPNNLIKKWFRDKRP